MYSTETYNEPFWAESANFIRGRDPLGVQNSSISVYGKLLPGMTNLTLRLRYYGMYLWLLEEYHNLPHGHKLFLNADGQYNFIRRAELILAYLMVNLHENEKSVIGIDYVARYKEDLLNNGYYDIISGADRINSDTKRGVYWTYKSGAFGQYYVGSLILLGLIYPMKADRFFITEDKGLDLANAYKATIKGKTATLFLERILEGKLYEDDLNNLANIALNIDYKDSQENYFYSQMLLADDGLKSKTITGEIPKQRKYTLQLFLDLIDKSKEDNDWKSFPETMYKSYFNKDVNKINEAEQGWYYYYLNELVHYALETIFWALLKEMETGVYTVEQFIIFIGKKIDDYKKKNYPSISGSILSIINSSDNKFETLEVISEIKSIVRLKDPFGGMAKGLIALLCLYRDNKEHLEEVTNYAIRHSVNNKHGNAIDVFKDYIKRNEESNFNDFASKVAHTLINEHINIAYGKMRDGKKNLLKFIIEDGYLVHIETVTPRFTNPRLKTLYNFTKDLGLINKNNELTDLGKKIISQP